MIDWRRLDHVQICVPPGEEDAAATFYGDVLGLERVRKPASLGDRGGLWYRAGDVELHVGTEPPSGRSKRHPAFEVADVAGARAYLESRDVETADEPPIPGRERFVFRDPFGNRIELLEYE